MSATTALMAWRPQGIDIDETTALMAWYPQGIDMDETISSPAAFVKKAIDSCFEAGGVEVVKIGNDLLP